MAALVVAVWPSAAGGLDEDPVVLSWSAPADANCPDAAYVLREVRRRVGPARPEHPPVRANVAIHAARPGAPFQMVLRTEQGETKGERVLQDDSCGAVADAAVVVLAWMIDPTAMANEGREREPAPPVAQPTAEAKPALLMPTPRRPLSIAPFLGLATTGDAGTLPTAAFGGEGRGGLFVDPFRFALYGALWPTSSKTTATLPDGRSVGGTFTLIAFGLRACIEPPLGSAARGAGFALCVGPEIDSMRGRGFGVNTPTEGTKTWVAGVATAEGTLRVGGPFRLFLMVSGVVPAMRERYSLVGVGEVHQPSRFAGRAAAGIEWAP
jgi:hypothetical protein